MSAPEPAGDELDQRIRDLEAERIRPTLGREEAAARPRKSRIDLFLASLKRDFEHIHRTGTEEEEAT